MLKYTFRVALVTVLASFGLNANAAIVLYDWGYNVDGTFTDTFQFGFGGGDPAALGVDESNFDDIEGTGTVGMTFNTAGPHNFIMFVDHEITETNNGFINETVTPNGTAAAGQSYEGDEPGFLFGDIVFNVEDNLLDNSVLGFADDASMALGWNFTLAAGEVAEITMHLAAALPNTLPGFYLAHSDADVADVVYFWSTLSITGPGPGPMPVPAPAVIVLLMLGLLGAAGRRHSAR
ncbi:MAG: hypothetical protein AAF529_19675 [Pseudomonadota bacterium]